MARAPQRNIRSLKVGEVFRTRDTLAEAVGGTSWRGIEYLLSEDYVVLVSTPAADEEHNYADLWLSEDVYRFSGEWNGCRDMAFRAGNKMLTDRAEELHLFLAISGSYRYEGRFVLGGYDYAMKKRPRCGHQHKAIVFELNRARPSRTVH